MDATASLSREAPDDLIERLLAHLTAEWPREAVGVITDDWEIIPFRNLSRHEGRFLVWPGKLFRRGRAMFFKGEGLQLIYHSHRKDTRPSEVDIGFMDYLSEAWPHVDHLILNSDGDYQIWQYDA